ncbi:hypothetical protein C5167_007192 [Papaver somniferum]|uniref:DUF6469 domain-containing protein n=1 Tax=Papaver somniferum TaxID=3469 RepID=A0A4Y7JIM1_PAPSO|nr:hypothetical protein C5167_007192 [Papaver somniferum]
MAIISRDENGDEVEGGGQAVEKIPDRFRSVEEYLGSYTLPLIEETRSELFSSTEVLHDAPFAEVISVKESGPHGSFLYELEFDSWRNINNGTGKEPYSPKCGDLFVLSDVVPEIASDLKQCVRICTFALVMKDTKASNAAEEEFGEHHTCLGTYRSLRKFCAPIPGLKKSVTFVLHKMIAPGMNNLAAGYH